MKKSILWLLTAAVALGVSANPVDQRTAKMAANAWINEQKNSAFGAGLCVDDVIDIEKDPDTVNECILWYRVGVSNYDGSQKSQLIIAPDTKIEPVIMVLDNNPVELPSTVKAILTADIRRRLKYLGLYDKPAVPRSGTPIGPSPILASLMGASLINAVPAAAPADDSGVPQEVRDWGNAMEKKWERLISGSGASLMAAQSIGLNDVEVEVTVVKGFEKGGALTHWNQAGYGNTYLYNLHTPGKAVCGCVATACGALAQFYGTTNAAAYSADCTYNGIRAKYDTKPGSIDWNILPENWGGTNAAIAAGAPLSTEAQDLLGRVAYNAGVGVSMNWTDDESGAAEEAIVDALKNVFGFKHARCCSIDPEDNPSQEHLSKLMYNQLRAGVPVGFSIEGHSVVAVGYGIDADNVERVRVFMGWGGVGDGWYALPKIDTKSVVGGANYLSEIVDCIVTMISYDDDDIVPVAGHVSMPGVTLSLPALNRTIESNGSGYFGTRVPANLPEEDCKITCQGKEATFAIGADAAESDETEVLCASLPEAFEFSLINCTVAYSPKYAKLYAEREGKAILHISGKMSDENTIFALDHIFNLAEENVNDFTNRFVYLFSESGSVTGDGALLSYGVFLPRDYSPEGHWLDTNGRLGYGHADVNAQNEYDFVITTQIPTADNTMSLTAETNGVYSVTRNLVCIRQSIDDILYNAYTSFQKKTSGIKVLVSAMTEDEDFAVNAEAAIDADAHSDSCGWYEDCIAPGLATFYCTTEVTNATDCIVYECAGWTLRDYETGDEIESGVGPVARFNLDTNQIVNLEWDVSKLKAVKITVNWTDDDGVLADVNAVTPATGWYPAGVPVLFTATPVVTASNNKKYHFDNFTAASLPGAIQLSGFSVLVPTDGAVKLQADYRKSDSPLVNPDPAVVGTCAVRVTNYVYDEESNTVSPADDLVPNALIYTSKGVVTIANGATGNVPGTVAGVAVAATSYRDASGEPFEFYGMMSGMEIYIGEPLPIEKDYTDVTSDEIIFCWKSAAKPVADDDDDDDDEGGMSDLPTTFNIEWDAALSVLNASGFSTNLIDKALLEKYGISLTDVNISAPRGFVAKLAYDASGNIVATLDLDEEVLKPVGLDGISSPLTIFSNGDGSVTVKADVANGVKGFWYTLYATDDLTDKASWAPVVSGYEAGKPSDQAKIDDETVSLSIDILPKLTKRFFKLVVTDVKPGS